MEISVNASGSNLEDYMEMRAGRTGRNGFRNEEQISARTKYILMRMVGLLNINLLTGPFLNQKLLWIYRVGKLTKVN